MLFDTHFHLDLVDKPEEAVIAIEQEKIYTIAVTNLPKVYLNTEKLCEGCKYIRPALGYHPELVSKYNNQFEFFRSMIDRTRYIGEIGLDNLKKKLDDFNDQKRIFERIISVCGAKGDKILTIHSRKAETEVISMIGDNFPGKIILHWYTGSIKELEKALSYGFYFSINSAMVQSKSGINIIQNIPLDRVLLESDGPFIELNGKKSAPSDLGFVVKALGKIKGISTANTDQTLSNNFRSLL